MFHDDSSDSGRVRGHQVLGLEGQYGKRTRYAGRRRYAIGLSAGGPYVITLLVRDSADHESTTTATINVAPPEATIADSVADFSRYTRLPALVYGYATPSAPQTFTLMVQFLPRRS